MKEVCMLAVLSPAKRLDFETPLPTQKSTQPLFIDEATRLVEELRQYSVEELAELMKISENLAELNAERYQQWQPVFALPEARQAILAFKGDVYLGLDAGNFSAGGFTWAQDHLRTLSGLYGVLRPLDLIHAYRLEMGVNLPTSSGGNLYEFWGDKITLALNKDLARLKSPLLVNLASNEYFNAINRDKLEARVVDVRFLDLKDGNYKLISFFAKKARGLMAAFMVANRPETVTALKEFDWHGYQFNAGLSDEDSYVFVRDQKTEYRG